MKDGFGNAVRLDAYFVHAPHVALSKQVLYHNSIYAQAASPKLSDVVVVTVIGDVVFQNGTATVALLVGIVLS